MKKFNWRAFECGKIAVNCVTKEDAADFIKQCINRGMKWAGGEPLSLNMRYGHGCTCYGYCPSGLQVSSSQYWAGRRWIVKWIPEQPVQSAQQDTSNYVRLLPVTWAVGHTVSDQLNKVKEELDEAFAARDNVDRYELCEELVDIQVACQTALEMLGCDINKVRAYVNEKNRKRGYLDEKTN